MTTPAVPANPAGMQPSGVGPATTAELGDRAGMAVAVRRMRRFCNTVCYAVAAYMAAWRRFAGIVTRTRPGKSAGLSPSMCRLVCSRGPGRHIRRLKHQVPHPGKARHGASAPWTSALHDDGTPATTWAAAAGIADAAVVTGARPGRPGRWMDAAGGRRDRATSGRSSAR